MANQVQLKIKISATGAVKTLPFDVNMSAGEVCREIKDKVGQGGSDHGLFKPSDDYNTGKWLENNKTLAFYELRSGVRTSAVRRQERLHTALERRAVRAKMGVFVCVPGLACGHLVDRARARGHAHGRGGASYSLISFACLLACSRARRRRCSMTLPLRVDGVGCRLKCCQLPSSLAVFLRMVFVFLSVV